jgi:hypothetical protein
MAAGDAESLAAALAKLPRGFRGHPCYVILPKIHPFHKCIIHHPVSPDLRRIMLSDAIEMDLPIKADAFAWDFLPLHSYDTNERFLSYVFAERWYQIDPIFGAFLRAKIYPKGALVPLAIEFCAALAEHTGTFFQLCIDEATISMVLVGGERPYVRTLPYGWNRILRDEGIQGQWDNWVKNNCAENEALAEKADEFFCELSAEIHTCELYYFHHLQGRPCTKMTIISSRPGPASWIKFFKKYRTHEPDVIYSNESWEYSTCGPGIVSDEITRMHLSHGAEMIFNETMDNPSTIVPKMVMQKERQSNRFIAKAVACIFACGILLFGNLYHTVQNQVLRKNLINLRQKTEEARATAISIGRLNGEIDQHRIRLERASKVHSCQRAWITLFQELQDILVDGENGWLDELRLMPSVVNGHREIVIGGCILAGEDEEISSKFRQFFEQLQELPTVGSVENLTLAERRRDMQLFRCTIALNTKYFQP